MKKQKILSIALATAFTVSLSIGATACAKKHVHAYQNEITPPSCLQGGYTTHTCDCGDVYVDAETPALGHDFAVYVSDGNATYTADGTKTARCEHAGCEQTDTVADTGSMLDSAIRFKTLTVTGDTASGAVSNQTEEFSFETEVEILGAVSYEVSKDKDGLQITEKTVPLEVGDNTFYVFEKENGNITATYTVTVRRRPAFAVTFVSEDGSVIENQTVEEEAFARPPQETPILLGYTFVKWDYDFQTPITGDITITLTPIWSAEWEKFYTYSENTITGLTDFAKETCTKLIVPAEICGEAVTSIGKNAFANQTAITEVVVESGITSIGASAFYNCSGLTEITLPESVISIGERALACCSDLTNIEISKNVTFIGDLAFSGCYKLSSITVSSENETYQSIDENLYTKDGTVLIQYAVGKTATSFSVPSGVTSIGDSAFYYCASLTKIVIPDSVTYIGNSAFQGCSGLTEIVIPDSVAYIGDAAFYSCINLTIYCEAETLPNGWDDRWNSSDRPVVWGYEET